MHYNQSIRNYWSYVESLTIWDTVFRTQRDSISLPNGIKVERRSWKLEILFLWHSKTKENNPFLTIWWKKLLKSAPWIVSIFCTLPEIMHKNFVTSINYDSFDSDKFRGLVCSIHVSFDSLGTLTPLNALHSHQQINNAASNRIIKKKKVRQGESVHYFCCTDRFSLHTVWVCFCNVLSSK